MQPRDRLKVVAAGLFACALAIAWGAWRHRNAPAVDVSFMFPETREHALTRLAAEKARQEAWLARTKVRIKRGHDATLGSLAKAENDLRANMCDSTRQAELGWSLYVYALNRTGAYRNAPHEGLVSEVAELWGSPADQEVVAIAGDLIKRGYVSTKDFKQWSPEYAGIFPEPQDAPWACGGNAG